MTNQIGSHSYGADGHYIKPGNPSRVPAAKEIAIKAAILAAKHYGPKIARVAFMALRSAMR